MASVQPSTATHRDPLEPVPVTADLASPSLGEVEPPAGFVKSAMRNMVRKGRQSLFHFGLTALGLTGFLVLIAWLGRPHLPQ
ncbi:MAG: DUF3285 domain-containing protein [Synechococcaceae cyanobacterium]|nr:DUF3285 domain-containing protein [Synechococcaceae cyanobacterium]